MTGERSIKIPAQAEGRLALATQNLLRLAQEEAIALNQNFVGTESLFLGLLRLPDDDPAKETLLDVGLNIDMVRQATELISGRYDREPIGEITLTPRSRRIIALAADEVSRLGETEITPLHILKYLVRDNEGIVFAVLESLGVNIATLQTAISRKRLETGKKEQEETPTLVSVTCKLQAFLHDPNAIQEEKDALLRAIDGMIPPSPTNP